MRWVVMRVLGNGPVLRLTVWWMTGLQVRRRVCALSRRATDFTRIAACLIRVNPVGSLWVNLLSVRRPLKRVIRAML